MHAPVGTSTLTIIPRLEQNSAGTFASLLSNTPPDKQADDDADSDAGIEVPLLDGLSEVSVLTQVTPELPVF